MSIDYKPNYDSRDAHYAAKDAATAERDRENAEGGPKARAEPKAHNYLREGWGHTASINKIEDEGRKVTILGFGSGICPGDFIMKKNGEGTASYKIDTIKYHRDPPDQWSAKATFTPGVFGVTDDGRIVKLDNG